MNRPLLCPNCNAKLTQAQYIPYDTEPCAIDLTPVSVSVYKHIMIANHVKGEDMVICDKCAAKTFQMQCSRCKKFYKESAYEYALCQKKYGGKYICGNCRKEIAENRKKKEGA